MLRKNKIPWLDTADWVAPYLALGHAIGRIGCFLVGDCYGTACNLPWAVKFPNGLPPTIAGYLRNQGASIPESIPFNEIVAVHPTQLYEFSLYILIFLYLIYIRTKRTYNGVIMFEYLFLAGLTRFLVEFLRINPAVLLDLSGAQIISIIMMVVSTYLMYINRNKLKEVNV